MLNKSKCQKYIHIRKSMDSNQCKSKNIENTWVREFFNKNYLTHLLKLMKEISILFLTDWLMVVIEFGIKLCGIESVSILEHGIDFDQLLRKPIGLIIENAFIWLKYWFKRFYNRIIRK